LDVREFQAADATDPARENRRSVGLASLRKRAFAQFTALGCTYNGIPASRDQDRFAKYLVSAFFMGVGDICRYP
jgi:hypothetical protein